MNNESTLFLQSFIISFASSVVIGYLSYKLANIDKNTTKETEKKKERLKNIDAAMREKNRREDQHELSQETIQLMTGRFRSVSVKNFKNFLKTLNLPLWKTLIFGVNELDPTAVTMTIGVEKDEDGEFKWTIVADHPLIPEQYRPTTSFYLNVIDEEKVYLEPCLSVTDINSNKLETLIEFDDGLRARSDFSFSKEGMVSKQYVGDLSDAEEKNIAVQEFKRLE